MIQYHASTDALFLTVFIAATVEMVEALTIVLAIGLTRGWRSTLIALGAALLALASIVALLGPALAYIPLQILHLLVGGLLLVFGLQWLRKAILRASGVISLHDEDALYAREVKKARSTGRHLLHGLDWYGFTVVFKGVLLEGLEVVFIVLSFGAAQGSVPVAAVAAALSLVMVSVLGLFLRRPLASIPENTLKFIVGIMLTVFGMFWAGSGAGLHWPGGNLAILGLLAYTSAVALAMVPLTSYLSGGRTSVGPAK